MATILLLIAQKGFQAKEYGDTKSTLEHAGHTVMTASVERGVAISNMGEEVGVDVALHEAHATDYDGVFAIGGPGALISLDNAETVRIMTEAKAEGSMPYGAICIAPRILLKAGLLKGARVTGWDNDGKLGTLCENTGATHELRSVISDGRVITANGPQSAREFGEAIARALEK